MRETNVFFITGFLESGKTSLICSWLENPELAEEKNLVICFEEGEEEYTPELMEDSNASLVMLDGGETEVTSELLAEIDKKYRPDNIFVEWNGMRPPGDFFKEKPPKSWLLLACVAVVDSVTYDVYSNNMRSLFADYFRFSNTVMFNRCGKDSDLLRLRAGVKAVNPSTDIVFIDDNGMSMELGALPFDLDSDPVVISDDDFGLWFTDAMENVDRYMGKRIQISGRTLPLPESNGKAFYIARPAMTCCADDISNICVVCMYSTGRKFKYNRWVTVTGTVKYASAGPRDDPSAVPYIEVENIEETTAPKVELVNFT